MKHSEKTEEPDGHKISEGRIAMRPEISEEEAIRTIAREGTCADYIDIANLVRERFGLRVGTGRVEEVVMAMKQDMPSQPVSRLKNADIKLAGDLHQATEPGSHAQPAREPVAADSTLPRHEVLKFVESMGGFEAARAAISDLEQSLKHLMK